MIGDPGYYDGPEHPEAEIRGKCTGNENCPGHVVRPFNYDREKWKGRWGGVSMKCYGIVDETVSTAIDWLDRATGNSRAV